MMGLVHDELPGTTFSNVAHAGNGQLCCVVPAARRPSPIATAEMTWYLLTRCEGTIGELRRETATTAKRIRTRKLAARLEEGLAGDFRAGTPVDELVTKSGVSRATLYRIAREHNVKNTRSGPR